MPDAVQPPIPADGVADALDLNGIRADTARQPHPTRSEDGSQVSTMSDTSNADTEASGHAEKEASPMVPVNALFRFADGKDRAYLAVGALGGIANGTMLPFMTTAFGTSLNGVGMGGAEQQDKVRGAAMQLLYFGIIAGVGGFLQFYCFKAAAERQLRRVKRAYLSAVLRQDIAWFDEQRAGALLSRMGSSTYQMSDGLGEKLGLLCQFTGMFFAGFYGGFSANWRLSLVLLSIAPLMVIVGGIVMAFMAKVTSGSEDGYAAAGAVADEAIGAVRTVCMLAGGETRVQEA